MGTTSVATAAGSHQDKQSAPQAHHFKLKGLDAPRPERNPNARRAVFVQFAGEGAADVAGRTGSAKAAAGRRAEVAKQAASAVGKARAADSKAASLFTVANAVPGVGLVTNGDGVKALAAMPGVVKVSRIVPKTFENANTAVLVKAIKSWKYAGGTGAGVKVGIIDTGIDYTHADFGGPGTTAAYDDALAVSDQGGWRSKLPALGKAKILGGYDFAGDDYNADPASASYQPVPNPDGNPLDCGEHGTHVAGTAAGYGVAANGSTFTGNYTKLTADKLMAMDVGPGMAPKAGLYGLKVFGCEGSTDLVIPALDWALDPNGDGNFKDHLDIINMSLGSDYGNEDDPENVVIAKLAKHGVLSVLSMGNNGDLTDTGGAPGNAVSGLAVASSVDSYQLRDGIEVTAPADVAGTVAGQMSVAYDWANNGPSGNPVSGSVVKLAQVGNEDGCDPLDSGDAAAVSGKVAWLVWDDNDATRRCGSVARSGNVKAAGAIGAIFTSGLEVFGAGITGDSEIPVFQIPKSSTDALQPAVDAGTLEVTFDGATQATIKDVNPAISDTLSSFSSRGTHGSIGVVKPDVAAPGDTVASAFMGSGNGVLALSGTSMASPLTAGVSAIVKSRHPGWSPLQIKAAVMNNATHDVTTGNSHTGFKYGPARVGAGRVDALAASKASVLAYVNAPTNAVSASFGPVEAPIDGGKLTKTKKLVVQNTGRKAVSVKLDYQSVISTPGVTYKVSPSTLTVPAGSSRKATVTMAILPLQLRHTLDPSMEATQILGGTPYNRQYVSDASGRLLVTPKGKSSLRVPVYGAAKPVSTTTATATATDITLAGAGVNQGGGMENFASQASVMQLGATSDRLPTCAKDEDPINCVSSQTERAGDIKQIGAGTYDDMLWFGVSTYGDWANVGNTLSPDVYFDTTGDGDPDYETFVGNVSGTDLLMAWTYDLATGDLADLEPVNFASMDQDTNVFDTNVILLPVWKGAVGLPETVGDTSAPISYEIGTYYGYTGDWIDDVPATGTFDAGTPELATNLPLYGDAGGEAIPYTAQSSGIQALVFHLFGQKGSRSEVLTLP
ncbi:MAG: S8 family serine peptidase [Nocardioidaceae bacterium]